MLNLTKQLKLVVLAVIALVSVSIGTNVNAANVALGRKKADIVVRRGVGVGGIRRGRRRTARRVIRRQDRRNDYAVESE